MIIYLHGPDSYRRQKEFNRIIEEYRQKHSNLSWDYFDLEHSAAEQEEFLRLKEFSSQQPLFGNKKLAVLKNIFEIDAKILKGFLKRYLNSEDFTILISENNLPPKELEFLSKKAFLVEEFEALKGEKWRFFIQKEAQRKKVNLTQKAIDFLAQAYFEDSWGLVNEVEKLSFFSKDSAIDVDDLKKVGDYGYKSPDIFGFINAVVRNDLSQKIIALEKLFVSQEEPVKVFNIFASLNRLPKDLICRLADYDIMVKSGKLDYGEVLVDLAL